MKMKKRLLALFVALTMLTGCAANEGGGTGGESQGSAGAQELRLLENLSLMRLNMVGGGVDGEWRKGIVTEREESLLIFE